MECVRVALFLIVIFVAWVLSDSEMNFFHANIIEFNHVSGEKFDQFLERKACFT